MLLQQTEAWWQHTLETFLGAGVPVILWTIKNRQNARKQVKEEQDKVKEELEKKHKENTLRLDHQDEKLEELLEERKYIQPHMHRERRGTLTAENIHFPKR